VLIAGGDPVAIRVCLLELREQGNFNFAIIYRSLAGAPEEIRTPDPQIRSLVLAYRCGACRLSGGGFGLAAKPLVCGSDGILSMASFEPAHDEVRPRHLLEVVDERVVYRRTRR
jgi:hypothetical protein